MVSFIIRAILYLEKVTQSKILVLIFVGDLHFVIWHKKIVLKETKFLETLPQRLIRVNVKPNLKITLTEPQQNRRYVGIFQDINIDFLSSLCCVEGYRRGEVYGRGKEMNRKAGFTT